ncbi:MAG: T9SS type A sorting domain-containing protein [Bacteroidales bacterium]|nr:T9SS type A sorting domain-containing protein [Bacteroidales bacterium]
MDVDYNKLAECADFLNNPSRKVNDEDLQHLFDDDDFAIDVTEIADIAALAENQLNKKSNKSKIIKIIASVAAAAIIVICLVNINLDDDMSNLFNKGIAHTESSALSISQDLIANKGEVKIIWEQPTNSKTDTLIIYDLNGNEIFKTSVNGKNTIISEKLAKGKYIYTLERNGIDILEKGTINVN